MNPNGQVPLDYLNQIAPQTSNRPKFVWNLRTIIFAALSVIALIILIATIAGAVSNSNKEPWQRMSARLDGTTALVDGASANIKSSQLRSINSDLKLYLANTKRDLATPMTELGIEVKKIPKDLIAKEAATDIAQRLENGRLNARYDSTYAREMTYQVAQILSQIQVLHATNVGPKTKALLKTAYDNLVPTYESLSKFSTSTE